jgi:hypothetical protein
LRKLHEWLPSLHFEKRYGSQSEAIAYCSKEDTRVDGPWEYGTCNKQGDRTDLELAADIVRAHDVKRVAEEMPAEYVKFHKGLEKLRLLEMPVRNWKTTMEVHYGAASAGKTRYAYHSYPDLYRVN